MASILDQYMIDQEMDQAPMSMDDLIMATQSGLINPEDPANAKLESIMPNAEMGAQALGPSDFLPTDLGGENSSIYAKKLNELSAQDQARAEGLQKYINQYAAQPQGIDFTPAAALTGNALLMQAAQNMRPDSPQARGEKLMGMRTKLAEMQSGLTRGQLDSLNKYLSQQSAEARMKQALGAQEAAGKRWEQDYKLREKAEAERARHNAEAEKSLNAIRERNLNERQATRQEKEANVEEAALRKFEEKQIDATPLATNLSVVEDILGGKLEDYDFAKNKVNDQSVDLPGKSVPLVGRVYQPGSVGEKLNSAIATIFNTELKTRSGAAVTDNELARLKNEFASGKFNTEPLMLDALKRYKQILRRKLAQHEAAYKPEVLKTYKDRGGYLADDFFGGSAPAPDAAAKLKRLQELKAKAAQ
jgi:hypothetical protein